eukprot:TRINITY_DN6616_c0_g1_i1.p1 TRINITY_DN6616_c0_g1~~TRINITY_DN6616_c0_g1_i1.p1  ORF type:complete len:156 (+),score=19.10 TRINITY_DN6616_c0_g1_i1:284-751(+)
MIHFFLIVNKQGKVRLSKWYSAYSQKERVKTIKDIELNVVRRSPDHSNFMQWKDKMLVYRKYASLYFVMAIDEDDNELLTLEIIHRFCHSLEVVYGKDVCELDIVYHFENIYAILDEYILAGELIETSADEIHRQIQQLEGNLKLEMLEQLGFAE